MSMSALHKSMPVLFLLQTTAVLFFLHGEVFCFRLRRNHGDGPEHTIVHDTLEEQDPDHDHPHLDGRTGNLRTREKAPRGQDDSPGSQWSTDASSRSSSGSSLDEDDEDDEGREPRPTISSAEAEDRVKPSLPAGPARQSRDGAGSDLSVGAAPALLTNPNGVDPISRDISSFKNGEGYVNIALLKEISKSDPQGVQDWKIFDSREYVSLKDVISLVEHQSWYAPKGVFFLQNRLRREKSGKSSGGRLDPTPPTRATGYGLRNKRRVPQKSAKEGGGGFLPAIREDVRENSGRAHENPVMVKGMPAEENKLSSSVGPPDRGQMLRESWPTRLRGLFNLWNPCKRRDSTTRSSPCPAPARNAEDDGLENENDERYRQFMNHYRLMHGLSFDPLQQKSTSAANAKQNGGLVGSKPKAAAERKTRKQQKVVNQKPEPDPEEREFRKGYASMYGAPP